LPFPQQEVECGWRSVIFSTPVQEVLFDRLVVTESLGLTKPAGFGHGSQNMNVEDREILGQSNVSQYPAGCLWSHAGALTKDFAAGFFSRLRNEKLRQRRASAASPKPTIGSLNKVCFSIWIPITAW